MTARWAWVRCFVGNWLRGQDIPKLTPQQAEMLDILLENGAGRAEIAERMAVAYTTVRDMLFVVMRKRGYGTVLELAVNELHKRYGAKDSR